MNNNKNTIRQLEGMKGWELWKDRKKWKNGEGVKGREDMKCWELWKDRKDMKGWRRCER